MDVPAMFSLEGKTAAVLGGTGVLGHAFCRGLASAGASVAVLGRSEERGAALARELASGGRRAMHVCLDATSKQEIAAAHDAVVQELGAVDILVNAAGVNAATPFLEIAEAEWDRILDTNLRSVLFACQVFATAMIARGEGGTIVNISSVSSEIPLSRVLAYSVSKSGINSLTRWLARELAPHRIRVNAIAPGFFPAEQNRAILSPDRLDAIRRHTPLGRLGEPDELIGALVWLASDRASGYVTGAIVHVDGGFTAMTI